MKQEMLINVSQPEECRIAIVEEGVLEELYIERTNQDSYVGNIYKGVVVNLEPSIQAAFVDFGVGRNGFLHVSDLEPQYFRQGGFDPQRATEDTSGGRSSAQRGGSRRNQGGSGRGNGGGQEEGDIAIDLDEGSGDRPPRPRGINRGGRPRIKPPIQDVLRRGDEVLVQVIKEGIGTKGPTLSTYISIPGRYLVLMPALGRVGVSRKIEDEEARRRLRSVMAELNPPKGLGFIVRTAGIERTKRELSRDLAYLLRLWKAIVRRVKKMPGPVDIYEESDMIIRTIRDIFTGDVDSIYIDEPAAHERAKEFLQLVMPRHASRLHLYEGKEPLFHKYHLDEEIAKIHRRDVPLKTGGSIVIDQTEALVAIDVNSGRNRRHSNAETTALRTNQEAVEEIARQLRLRDLGGLVVVDFIDMREQKNRRTIDRCFREAVKPDRAKTKLLRINAFGLMEMTRQRLGPSLKSSVYKTCEACDGTGVIKSAESQALQVLRTLQRACAEQEVAHVHVRVTPGVAHHLNNCQRSLIAAMEADANKAVVIEADPSLVGEECVVKRTNARGSQLVSPPKPSRKGRKAKAPRGKKSPRGEAEEAAEARAASRDDSTPDEAPGEESADEAPAPEPGEGQKKPRRRGRRGGRGRKRSKAAGKNVPGDSPRAEGQAEQGKVPADLPKADTPSGESPSAPAETGDKAAGDQPKPKPKRRRRKRATKKTARKADKKTADKDDSTPADGQDDNGTS